MIEQKNVLAICGSTRQSSANMNLIRVIVELYSKKININIFEGLSALPHYNPDLDHDDAPAAAVNFRRQLKDAEGVLICTPEYAMGVPGTLKNAIDWTVSSMEFTHKPVALITASTSGQKGHQALLDTLRILEANIPESSQLIISHVKIKVNNARIADEYTLQQVKRLVDSLLNTIDKNDKF